ncbi:MAG TPA: hypothetical protein VEB64_13075 [Azospirillaceae bacterium]|nr:hypothetical protein [Azospirillaceae bacterium]
MVCPKREAYESVVEHKIIEAGDRLERLRHETERVWWDGRTTFERALDNVRGQRNQALAKLEHLRMADDDAWPTVKAQVGGVFTRLEASLNRLEGLQDRHQAA